MLYAGRQVRKPKYQVGDRVKVRDLYTGTIGHRSYRHSDEWGEAASWVYKVKGDKGQYQTWSEKNLRKVPQRKTQAKRSRTHAKTDVYFSETIQGVRIDYLTDWNSRFGNTLSTQEGSISTESYLRGNSGKLAELASRKGFKRVQVGSIGDFHYAGIRTGPFLPLDTMFLARFLKR